MTRNYKLILKSMIITIIVLTFSFFMFFIFNEGQKKLNGKAVSVSLTERSINFQNGDKVFKVEPDIEKTANILKFIYSHSNILPAPFCFKNMAEFFANGLF